MTNETEAGGIVYVLTNSAMPDLVKIGLTSRNSVEGRLKELYSTGVPFPFKCEYAARVPDENSVERALHMAFEPHRVNLNREFFKMEPERVIVLLKLIAIEDMTPDMLEKSEKIEKDDNVQATTTKRSSTPLSFRRMGIRYGSELKLIDSEETAEGVSRTATVVNFERVEYQGELYRIGKATDAVLGEGHNRGAPRDLWTYKGKTLGEIHNELS